ncbi:MAG: LpxD N-terminal domain-containing protein, partial [Bacteroidota bacterium]
MRFNNPVALPEIARISNSRIIGPSDVSASGINEIHMVEAGDITFVDHPKYYDKALQSAATYIIINKEVDVPAGKSLLFSEDPFSAYVSIVRHFRPFVPMDAAISSTAMIGRGTVMQPGVHVGNQAIIGRDCIIHPGVVIYDHCIIGDRVTIHAGTVIGADAFYFKRRPEGYDKMVSCGRVIIEDDVEIGASCTIDKGVSGDTVIGKGTKFDNMVHIGHDTVIGRNCLFAAQVGVAGVVRVEDDV